MNRAGRRWRRQAMRRSLLWRALQDFQDFQDQDKGVTPAALATFAAFLAAKGEPYRWLPCGCLLMRCPCCGDWSLTVGNDSCRLGGPEDPRHEWLCQEFAPSRNR